MNNMVDATPNTASSWDTDSVPERSLQETSATSPSPGSPPEPSGSAPCCTEPASPKPLKALLGGIDPAPLKRPVGGAQEHPYEKEKEEAWADAAGMVKTYSDEMVERWNKVIDTYLVFAGLFSVILTAFNVQSYQLLQPPSPDPVAVLQQISLQLHSFMLKPPFLNSTAPPADGPSPPNAASGPAAVPRSAIWLNILWFSGLIISLTSALLGILVKQWLNEYVSLGLSGNSREATRLRQYRLNNLVKWHVGDIVILIPVLLLISLGLFLAGLLVLLWTLHPAVVIVASVLVGVVGVITIGVTFLPLFNHTCAYLTPQTFALYSVRHHLWDSIIRPVGYYTLSAPAKRLHQRNFPEPTRPFIHIKFALCAARNLFSGKSEISPWNIRERHTVNSLSDRLDMDILNTAYDCTPDVKAISATAVCLLDKHPILVLDYFKRFHETAKKYSPRNINIDDLLVYQALLCTLQLETMGLFSGACSSVWKGISDFLPSVTGRHTSDNTKATLVQTWLQKAASWLEHRVLNPDTRKILEAPISDMWRGELDKLRSHCEVYWKGDITSHKFKPLWRGQSQCCISKWSLW
ncbi:hypothetical protein TRAPUB_12656 [Trametes pubescens]|uniref:DUF6535 domain-containing protein n=1 Tax=Trametes pubescens TaxID=154538 RepID=A0A1M2VT66_TRAPU|nr:hypothetical protein TRAPUB_12656 [Trametes pubescens]